MLDDPKLMKSLLDLIFKQYGWKSITVTKGIQKLIADVRSDERHKFARFFHQLLLDNQQLSVAQLLEKVKRGEHESCCRETTTR